VPVALGADSSTQSTKVELRDIDTGELLGAGRAAHPTTAPPRSEQDPRSWWDAFVHATTAALEQARTKGVAASDVGAIAVAGQQHGLVVLDASAVALRPAKLWNDTESADDATELIAELGGPVAWTEACGSVPVAAFTVTKLRWLHRHEPATFARVARVLLPHDWLTFRLTGAFATDRGDASGTGYWSPSAGDYRFDVLSLIDADTPWPDMVPTVLGPSDEAGALTPDAAAALGLVTGTLVAAGTGDNMAGALGVGLAPGDVAVSIGTSGTVFSVSERPTADPSGAVAGFADATGRFLPLVCTMNATRVTETMASLLGVDLATLDELALAAPAGAGGIVLLPYLDGERTPNRPDATGAITGLRTGTTRDALARAAFEGVVCGLLDGVDALVAAGGTPGPPTRLVLLGGGARSSAYRRVLADLGRAPVTTAPEGELVTTGACVQAAAAFRSAPPLDVVADWGRRSTSTTDPTIAPEVAAEVRRAYAIQRDRA
jgi:xylulokinase